MEHVVWPAFPRRRTVWVLAATLVALLLVLVGGGGRAAAADCRFVLGFEALHDAIPDTVGACLENEQHHPVSGDARQRTTNGLLVWRKADNRTAFTDGYRTWVIGPGGLRQRLNTERFAWEHDAAGFPLAGQDQAARLSVYFLRGEKIGAAQRPAPHGKVAGAAALAALLAGPTAEERAAGRHSEIPAGTVLQGLAVHGGVATVDLSGRFESGGGSLSMLARLAQVVFTLTQFPSVERVQFKLDGQPVEAFGGEGVILAAYATRRAFADLAPAILVESPAVGETVASPLRLQGAALVFEATFLAHIVAEDGRTIAEQVVTGTRPTDDADLPYRYDFATTFDVEVPFTIERPGRGALIVFEQSAKDGSRINVVEIPLILAR